MNWGGCIVVNWCLLYSTIKANCSNAEPFLPVLENFFYLTEVRNPDFDPVLVLEVTIYVQVFMRHLQ